MLHSDENNEARPIGMKMTPMTEMTWEKKDKITHQLVKHFAKPEAMQ